MHTPQGGRAARTRPQVEGQIQADSVMRLVGAGHREGLAGDLFMEDRAVLFAAQRVIDADRQAVGLLMD